MPQNLRFIEVSLMHKHPWLRIVIHSKHSYDEKIQWIQILGIKILLLRASFLNERPNERFNFSHALMQILTARLAMRYGNYDMIS